MKKISTIHFSLLLGLFLAFSSIITKAQLIDVRDPTETTIPTSGTFDIGTTTMGATVPNFLLIVNTHPTNTLTLASSSSISLGGDHPGDFSIDTDLNSVAIPALGTNGFSITFDPTAPGPRSATVTVTSDAANFPSYAFTITGTAVEVFDDCVVPTGDFETFYLSSFSDEPFATPTASNEFSGPTGWSPVISLLGAIFGDPVNIRKTSDGRSGTNAVELFSQSGVGLADLLSAIPCMNEAASLKGYYKFTGTGGDEAAISVTTDFGNEIEGVNTSILEITSDASEYTEFTLPILYNDDPATITVYAVLLTADGSGTSLKLDDFSLLQPDTQPPVIVGMDIERALMGLEGGEPDRVSIVFDEPGEVTVYAEELDDGSYDEGGSGLAGALINGEESFTFTCEDIGDNEVLITLFDNAGNQSEETFTVTIVDDEGPQFFEVSSERTAYLDENGQFVFDKDWLLSIGEESRASDYGGGIINDNCSEPDNITVEFDPEFVDCDDLISAPTRTSAPLGLVEVRAIAFDEQGNQSDYYVDVYVRDEMVPEVVLPAKRIILVGNRDATVTVTAEGGDGTKALVKKNETGDNCDIVEWLLFYDEIESEEEGRVAVEEGSSSLELGVGEYEIRVRGIDQSGNESDGEGILEIKVGDLDDFTNLPPVLVLDDQITAKNTPLIIPITFSDPDEDEIEIVDIESSNPEIISDENIYFEDRDGQLFLIIKPNAFATGETTVSITISDGNEEVVVTFTVIVSEVTGIEELISQAIQIYPNPTPGLVQVKIEDMVALLGDNPSLSYMDLTGRNLGEVQLNRAGNSFFAEIDLSSRPSGIYVLRISGNEYSVIKRIQKQ